MAGKALVCKGSEGIDVDRDKFWSAAAGAFIGASLAKDGKNQPPSRPSRHGRAAAWAMGICATLSFFSFLSGSFWGFVFFGVGTLVFPFAVMILPEVKDGREMEARQRKFKAILERLKAEKWDGKHDLSEREMQSRAHRLLRDSGYADPIVVALVDAYEWLGNGSAALAATIRAHAPINRLLLVVAALLGIGAVASPLAYLLFLLLLVGGGIGIAIRLAQRRPIAPWLAACLSSVPILVLHLALVTLLNGF